jgi:hypothetical protein
MQVVQSLYLQDKLNNKRRNMRSSSAAANGDNGNRNRFLLDVTDDCTDDEEEENGIFQRYEEEMSYSEIKTFLNQYYLIYPDYLPNSELF